MVVTVRFNAGPGSMAMCPPLGRSFLEGFPETPEQGDVLLVGKHSLVGLLRIAVDVPGTATAAWNGTPQ